MSHASIDLIGNTRESRYAAIETFWHEPFPTITVDNSFDPLYHFQRSLIFSGKFSIRLSFSNNVVETESIYSKETSMNVLNFVLRAEIIPLMPIEIESI